MKKVLCGFGVMALAALCAFPAFAEEGKAGRSAVGGMLGKTQGASEGGAVIESTIHHTGSGLYGNPFLYGSDQLRFELGTGFGLAGQGMGGLGYVAGMGGSGLLVGFEPGNLQFSVNADDDREDFIEWMPSVAAGLRLDSAICRVSALGRAGGALGTLGDGGVRTAKGVGVYGACPQGQFSGEMTRIKTDSGDVDLATADLNLVASPSLSIGLRGESIITRKEKVDFFDNGPGAGDKSERRVLLTAGGTF